MRYRDLLYFLLFVFSCAPAPPEEAPLFTLRTGTGVDQNNQLRPTEELNIVEYLYYYNGGGVAATDIDGDNLPDLFFTNNQGKNRYFINRGNWQFTEATEAAGVGGNGSWSTGVSVTDVNGDGLPDIYVCNVGNYKGMRGRNELYVQSADGTFTEQAESYGLAFGGFNTQAYWFDYDRDGDDDIYLLRHSVHSDATYRDGSGRSVPDSLAGDLLLRNDGGSFQDVTQDAGMYSSRIGYGLSAAIADFDGNGYPDVYVCNDFSENDYLYLNEGTGSFRESIRDRTGHTSNFSMGSDVGDLDGDGWPDLVTLDMRPPTEEVLKSTVSAESYNLYAIKRRAGYHHQLPRNSVQWNRRHGVFSEVSELTGLAATDWSWSVLVEDLDLDGIAEVFVANGIVRRPNDLDYLKFIGTTQARRTSDMDMAAAMPSGEVANVLLKRTALHQYDVVDWGLGLVGSSTGAAVADLDGDGDPDLVLNNVNAPASLYENHLLDAAERTYPTPDSLVTVYRLPNGRLINVDNSDHGMGVAQRGFLSQSEWTPRLISVPEKGESPDTVPYQIIARSERIANFDLDAASASFNREPLQIYPGAVPEAAPRYTLRSESGDICVEAGPWLPLRVGIKRNDQWTYEIIPETRGLWRAVTVGGTGGREIIATNWGLNSSLGDPDPGSPLRLYYEDLDGNGRKDPLFTYVRDGREYTLADKDELTGQLPGWRRNNLRYADYSQRDFAENFPGVANDPLIAETLAHLRLLPDGRGGWKVERLPRPTQITAVSAALITPQGVLLGGNTAAVLPRVGRQDAAALQLLRDDGLVQFLDLGADWNRREVSAMGRAGKNGYRIDFADGSWLTLRLS